MNESDPQSLAPLHSWLAMPMEPTARSMMDRVRHAEDVVHLAVMPDVHVANDICVGTAMATRRLVYPQAVGGDIGCGMLAIAFDAEQTLLHQPKTAGELLRELAERIPIRHRHRTRSHPLPKSLEDNALSHPALSGVLRDTGLQQLGTLGGGNHFIEFQADGEHRLWLMIHSGSRAIGQAVRGHHLTHATKVAGGLLALDTDTPAGQAYRHDQQWACEFAAANRQAIAMQIIDFMRTQYSIRHDDSLTISCDHNHVRREQHFGESWLVHRKGAMPADDGLPGVIPGSMGTLSYHVTGRGHPQSLRSSAHGAGRLLSRRAARQRFTKRDLVRELSRVWFDPRLADALREEAPKSYKDIRAVMRAQAELVDIARMLKPLLVYKGAA